MHAILLLLLLTFSQTASTVANGNSHISASPRRWHNSNCKQNRVAIVHLFEWKWADVAAECERFLSPMGFCAVQVSPPNEHAIIENEPWWQRYQPVSYRLHSRSGSEQEFAGMVSRCNSVGVLVYVDAIVNHMTGTGRSGQGSGGSDFNADKMDFPAVPYRKEHFHGCGGCPACCCINSWTDLVQVRNCRFLGLLDLNQSLNYVRQKIVAYLNRLIDIGVAGFRIDAAKHMWPGDLQAIAAMTKELPTRWFPSGSKAFFYLEVIDLSQPGEVSAKEYTSVGMVTEFRYCIKIAEVANRLWRIDELYDPSWGMLDSSDALVFVDNHDNQRGHGAGGNVVTFKDARKYKVAQAVTLAIDYGHPRVMSSYEFNGDGDGPPADAEHRTKDVVINADGSCGNGWVCEHRWAAIAGMASFRKAVHGQPIRNKRVEGNQVAFSRGGRGFIAISNEGSWKGEFQTGMPAGQYCNVIKGCPNSSGCDNADAVTVHADGTVDMKIDDWDNPIFAIHVEARAGSGSCIGGDSGGSSVTPSTIQPTTTAPPSTSSPEQNWQRTVILINKGTSPGQNLFIRGGMSHNRRPGCHDDPDTDPCGISIQTNSLGNTWHYNGYNDWRVGNTRLNWHGAQRQQGSHNGRKSEGTPAAWTSNSKSSPGYQPLNTFGDHYWMLDMRMDCSQADKGWFELKGFVHNGEGWEGHVNQGACSGSLGGSAPYQSDDHMARCGAINVFTWNANSCIINYF